ncbi:hypothetical protein BBBF_0740 [Bifidobacterium bifidum ATCC 29521 = JCM 1255 = DSM 20456]|uniref:Secreted protein n=1 Tax=Bifidobacterium bifidum ATCC 29521 = JCM 1255 = DSM 20456 TaxID=500634 RepID=A0ABN5UVW0_BIFBI|nr:hypothetical protein BIFBIF_00014 [Bifidobacterium bifidum ATCC 29521 = JCM 1255 = DSM 20456]BAQ97947.1 hypothetical protein BBBF_0740 [Bifidobacterium bifidum ATCC 29521 = JCM 1255 = DSM 20456]
MLFATRPVSWQRWKAIFWTLAAFRHFTDSRMAGLLDIRACRGCSGQPGSEDDRHRAKTTLSLAMLDRSRRRERDMKKREPPVWGDSRFSICRQILPAFYFFSG